MSSTYLLIFSDLGLDLLYAAAALVTPVYPSVSKASAIKVLTDDTANNASDIFARTV